MNVVRILSLLAVVVTLGQLIVVGLGTAHFVTLDGNMLRAVASIVALIVAILIPLALSVGTIQFLKGRGRNPRKGPIFAGLFTTLNLLGAGAFVYLVPGFFGVATSGATRLISTETPAAEEQPTTDEGSNPLVVPVGEHPTGGEAVTPASKTVESAKVLSSVENALKPAKPPAFGASLSNESAAALGVVWMDFLDENFEDLEAKAGPELWVSLHKDLTPQPGLWEDPAAIESVLVVRGKSFLSDVAQLADILIPGEGTGPLAWPFLPDDVLEMVASGADLSTSVHLKAVALNRMEASFGGNKWDIHLEDGSWGLHLGDYGAIANRRVSNRSLWMSLRP